MGMENGKGTDDVLPKTLEMTLDQTRSDKIFDTTGEEGVRECDMETSFSARSRSFSTRSAWTCIVIL